MKRLPTMPAMCATCPFREGSPYANLRTDLTVSAMTTSRICHSTGSKNAINWRTGKKRHLCRGARDFQLRYWFARKFISAPTDEAWDAKCKEFGL